MLEFYKVSFDAGELEAMRAACGDSSSREDMLLDLAGGGSLGSAVIQESRADDMLLIKNTVAIFKPGQIILITEEDLNIIKKCLKDHASSGPAGSAIKKIDTALSRAAERR